MSYPIGYSADQTAPAPPAPPAPAEPMPHHATHPRRPSAAAARGARAAGPTRAARYAAIVRLMKQRHGVRVRKWRRSMSGCAWRVYYHDGRAINWIEAPRPKTPLSLAIFLHEVGHHVIGFDKFKKRCEEEYHVWEWAIDQMRRLGVEPDDKVLRRFELSMEYAVGKALRRGIKHLPESLKRFSPRAA